ncbi:hypothetical protein JCM15765_19460 [Paradesulfitobacterium aromaticivorans]
MSTLILKDFLNLRKILPFVLVYGLIMIVGFQSIPDAALTASTVAITYLLMLQACARDDKNKSEIMLNSLPLKRKTIVAAKYLTVFLYAALGLVSYLIAYVIVVNTGIPVHVFPLSLSATVGVVIAAILMSSLYYPVYFKFGLLKSNIYGMVIFFAFFFSRGLVLGIVKRLANSPLPPSIELVLQWLSRQSEYGLAFIILIIGLALMGLSYLLSVRFYSGREF